MDDFDFDDLQDEHPKKPNDKKQVNKQQKKNSWNISNDDFYDLQIQDKPKPIQSKLNNLADDYLDSETENYTKNKKNQKQTKQNESLLPKINVSKSPRNSQQKSMKKKMDLSLEELPEKKVFVVENQKKSKIKKEQQQENDFAVYGTQKQSNSKSQLKSNISPLKSVRQKVKQVQNSIEKNSAPLQKVNPTISHNIQLQNKKVQNKKKVQQNEQEEDYQQEYQQEILEEQNVQEKIKTPQKNNIKQEQQKQQKSKAQIIDYKSRQINKNNGKESIEKNQTSTKRSESKDKKTIISQKSKQQNFEQKQKINKYKQMVQKSFPNDQDEVKVQKLKPDAINRLNQKMREMIKGFSKQLTDMIDKNLTLLRKPQNQIKEQIEGQSDPVETQIKLLEQMKKNNQKVIQNTQKQLQTLQKTKQKMSTSVESNAQMTEQIQTYKRQIAIVFRENSNLRNEIEKQGKKVTKLQQNNKQGFIGQQYNKDSKFKSALEITQKLANQKLQFDKNKKKLQQSQQKLSGLEDKITQITKKRNKIYEKAENQGISFHTKQQKKRYDQLKKKRDQHQVFQSKYKSSIKSKQAVIQYQMADFQVVIAEYEKRYELMNQQAQKSKEKIFLEINKAKNNPKLHLNTRQILTQLQLFMSDENPNKTQQDQNSLNLISKNIYKKQYQSKGHSKTLNDEKTDKKVQYKNYLQQVARKNEEARKRMATERKISQHNPFRKAATPNESGQVSLTVQKMNKTKQPIAESSKQIQRVWKSSNTQVLLRNPLKRQNDKNRYNQVKQQQNPMQNKEIMKLINKNKEKITLKQQEKNKVEQQSTMLLNKKPFALRTNAKQQAEQLNELVGISKQMEKIGMEIQSHRGSLKREYDKDKNSNDKVVVQEEQNLQVKLKDHNRQQQQPISLQATLDLKPTSNTTPFKNFRLRKDKDKQNDNKPSSDTTFKMPTQKLVQQKFLQTKEGIKQIITEQPALLKPKRFNLRKRNQNQSQSYIPSTRNIQNNNTSLNSEQKSQIKKDVNINFQQNKPKRKEIIQFNKKPIENSQKEQVFDPFKKFMINQKIQQKSISLNQQPIKQTINIDDNKEKQINLKPRMNLYKKGMEQTQNSKKLILLGDQYKKQKITDEKFLNPYTNQQVNNNQKQLQIPKIQRQGRQKRMNPPANSLKPTNKNIFADVEDATLNTNIKILGDPQPPKKEPQLYVPKSINNEKQLNINDLLGIKKKNFQVDKQLLIDLASGNNKVSVKSKAKEKPNDFFGDLDI